MNHLKPLVLMQLKDKIDMSFLKSRRSLLFKIAAVAGQILISAAAFFVFFYLTSVLKLFSFLGFVPADLVTAMFTLMMLLSIVGCTVGMTKALYMTADNRMLLTLPVPSNMVFLSKFVLYYIFELKKNLTFTMPMFFAYGIVMNAVWYFYPWMLFCFVFISLLPVALGAVLSIPALFVATFVGHFKWLQALLALAAAGFVSWALFNAINLIPENINLAGQWGSIVKAIQDFLAEFARIFAPFHYLNLMVVGGTAEISHRLFNWTTLITITSLIAILAFLIAGGFFLAKPLFFKMASKQFEFEKMVVPPKKNKIHKKNTSLFFEDLKRNARSSRYLLKLFVSLAVLPIAVFFLNKTYAAMNTRLTGEYMTLAFSLGITLLILFSDNVSYTSVYSRDGNARFLEKTRPVNPATGLFSRLIVRIAVIAFSASVAVALWAYVIELKPVDAVILAVLCIFAAVGHLLWCAEMDVMKPQSDQYATVGVEFDNPNERNATILAFLISIVSALLFYLFLVEGQTAAIIKFASAAAVFMVARFILYFTRIRLYYAEK